MRPNQTMGRDYNRGGRGREGPSTDLFLALQHAT
jgi:hypothetical protein